MSSKLAVVVGARPQFIKLSPLLEILRGKIDLIIIHTGQHYDFEMSELFFDQLRLPSPHYNLGIGSANNTIQTGRMLIELDGVFAKENPAAVVVIGDTNSTLAGALAAAQRNLPLVHVEAGLRSKDKRLPEQINRVVTDRLSDLLCCPTQSSVRNLEIEGIVEGTYLTGDILYDLVEKIKPAPETAAAIVRKYGLQPERYFYLTTHRAGNVDNVEFLTMLVSGLHRLPADIVFPVHPRTLKNLVESGLYEKLKAIPNVKISQPIGIVESLGLTQLALGVITDSGGLQREAAYFGKITWLLRDETEWIELADCGAVICGGTKLPPEDFDWRRRFSPGADYFRCAAPSIAALILQKLV